MCTCLSRMIWIVALYCARLWLVLALVNGRQLTQQEEDEILDLHNMYRSMVKPEASNMMRMKWNQSLTTMAAKYSTECMWEHSPNLKNTWGENLYITTGNLKVSKALMVWFNEYKYYDYYTRICQPNQMCGHYTQMVWATTTDVGCASHFCKTTQGFAHDDALILVCNYYPTGNWKGGSPYKEGKSCSKCPENTTCIDKACGSAELPKQSAATLLLPLLLTGLMAL